jgi:hypothetical protein
LNKRDKNRLRNRVLELLAPNQALEAQLAWRRAWDSRREGILGRDVDRARLAMLSAIDAGQSLDQAEQIARLELARIAA